MLPDGTDFIKVGGYSDSPLANATDNEIRGNDVLFLASFDRCLSPLLNKHELSISAYTALLAVMMLH